MTVAVVPMVVNDDDEIILFDSIPSPVAFGFLSRENSGALVLSRENSGVLVKTPRAAVGWGLARSDSLTFPMLSRENSGAAALCKLESSADIDFLLNSDGLIDLVCQLTPKAEAAECEDSHPMHEETQAQDDAACFRWPISHSHAVAEEQDDHPPSSAAGEPCPCPRQQPQKHASRRGAHVRGRPEMQRTAREGAAHWHRKVQEVRAAWEARAASSRDFRDAFAAQAALAQTRVKSKQECLLRFLHMAAADGLVRPSLAASADEGFFGWEGLRVAEGRGAAFRAGLEALFAGGFRENTVREGFRRAGLLPVKWQWDLAWEGGVELRYTRPGPE